MKQRITKRTVDAATSKNGKDIFFWDDVVPGFGLKVTGAGNKMYVLQTRLQGRLRRYTIGRHGAPWTPDTARKEALRCLGLIVDGQDPADEKQKMRNDLRVGELCTKYFEEGCSKKKETTLRVERGLLQRHIRPLLGHRKIRSLMRNDIERFHSQVAEGRTATDVRTGPRGRAIVKGGKGTANRSLDLLASILAFAVNDGLLDANPARGIKRYRLPPRERFLSPQELARLGEALEAAAADGANIFALAAIRFLILTGTRKGEALMLRWDWIDLEHGVIRYPDSKTGAKQVPLSSPVLDLLGNLPRLDGNPHVFPSESASGHFEGLQKVWNRVRTRAVLAEVRLHDLRHSYASVGVVGGDSLYLVGKLLGHAQAHTTQRYAHLGDDPIRAAAERIAGRIASDMREPSGGKVVSIGRPAPPNLGS